MEKKEIRPRGPINATVRPPGSKSITNRALLIAALATGRTRLSGVLDSEDTRIMLDAIRQLGTPVRGELERDAVVEIDGRGGRFASESESGKKTSGDGPPGARTEIYVGNSGTSARFLTAALAFSGGAYRMDGKPRMRERPIGDLIDALRPLGARIECELANGCPPLLFQGWTDPARASSNGPSGVFRTSVSGAISSQFLSALLLAAPMITDRSDVRIGIEGGLVSKPYIEMTVRLMEAFGVAVQPSCDGRDFLIPRGACYRPRAYAIEPDASAASYFFAAAAVLGGRVTVQGLSRDSLQGDVRFVECLERMGAHVQWERDAITVARDPAIPLRGTTVDMNPISDTAQTLGCLALFAEGPTTITGIAHARHKETDRIAALAAELRKFGAAVEEHADGLTVVPPPDFPHPPYDPVEVATYDDHRMAMSFAIIGLRRPGVRILDPRCTEKTYPGFFDDLERL